MTISATAADPWPEEIRLKAGRQTLEVTFDDQRVAALPAEFLRVMTPSAERKSHAAGEEKILGGKRGVRIRAVEPVGQYAVRLVFDDGHSTGLYTFAYLARLGAEKETLWHRYEEGLAGAGLDRDQPGDAPWPGGSGLRG